MPQTKTGYFAPLLKPVYRFPLAFSRLCDACKNHSICVNRAGDCYLACYYPYCKNRGVRTYLDCALRHRNFELARMTLGITEETTLELEAKTLAPDLDKMEDSLTTEDGPYQACGGILCWSEGQFSAKTFLKCNRCTAMYDSTILACFGLDGVSLLHEDFVSVQEPDNPRKPVLIMPRSQFRQNGRVVKVRPVPTSSALLISAVRWNGEEVWDAEPQFVNSAPE